MAISYITSKYETKPHIQQQQHSAMDPQQISESRPQVFISSILLYPKSALDPKQITFLIDMSLFTYF